MKYLFHESCGWDSIEEEFIQEISIYNKNNPNNKIENVHITDVEYLGDMTMPIIN